jgi:serine/threonine protein kinase
MLKESTIKQIIMQVLLACDFMHRKGVIHRDIKLENILIKDDPNDGSQI